MSTGHERKSAAKTTSHRYPSITELMKGEEVPDEVQRKFAALKAETSVTEQLATLRQCARITQQQMGKHLGVSQATISKIESGHDEDLTLAVIRAYCQVTGQRVGLVFGKPMSHVESVRDYAFGIKHHLTALAGSAHQDEELDREISGFFGEAFFNILTILSRCNEQTPQGREFEIHVQPLEQTSSRRDASVRAARLATA
jgi:transcriptional regulator with XRE-family HTH domain